MGAGFGRGTGTGIKRELVARSEEEIGVVPGSRLGAVAVMHVEIHHRHALPAPGGACVMRRDGGVGKETETHGAIRLGMMSRRPGRHEGGAYPAAQHRIYRR